MIADVLRSYPDRQASRIKVLHPLLLSSFMSKQGLGDCYSDTLLLKHSSLLLSDVIIVPCLKNKHWTFMVLFRAHKYNAAIRYYMTPFDSMHTRFIDYITANGDCFQVMLGFLIALHSRLQTPEVVHAEPGGDGLSLSTPRCSSGKIEDKTTGESALSMSSGEAIHVRNPTTVSSSKVESEVEIVHKPFINATTVSMP
jgi:hypothetical protein